MLHKLLQEKSKTQSPSAANPAASPASPARFQPNPSFHTRIDACWVNTRHAKIQKEIAYIMDPSGTYAVDTGYYDPFKLHVYIHPDDRNRIRPILSDMLKRAILDGVITGYKFYIEAEDGINPLAERCTHWGHVIYLPANY